MATHSSVLAWRIPGMTEPNGLPSLGSQSRTRLKRLSSSRRRDAGSCSYLSAPNYAFQEALNSAGEKLVVVDFSATWCGPCKMIKPFFHSLSEKYSNVVFLEVDVDDCQDVAAECEVKCMPTFQFFKKGQKVSEFSGANKEKLEATINELI